MNDVLLTLSQVSAWRAEKAELERVIQQAEEKLGIIERKLEAVDELLGATPVVVTQPVAEKLTLGQRIMNIVKNYPDGAAPAEIRDTLRLEGYDMTALDNSPTYLYTALGRLVNHKKTLERVDGRYRVVKPVSS